MKKPLNGPPLSLVFIPARNSRVDAVSRKSGAVEDQPMSAFDSDVVVMSSINYSRSSERFSAQEAGVFQKDDLRTGAAAFALPLNDIQTRVIPGVGTTVTAIIVSVGVRSQVAPIFASGTSSSATPVALQP